MRLRTFCFCVAGSVMGFGLYAAETTGQSEVGKPASAKSYQIRNKKFGELLRPEEANSANGTPIVLYPAQQWKCLTWKFSSAGEERFHLQNHFTSKTFAAKPATGATEAAVTQVPYGKKAEERPSWQFIKLADGTYKINDVKSGNALSAVKDANGGGVKIVVKPWTGGEEQKWELQEIDPKSLTM